MHYFAKKAVEIRDIFLEFKRRFQNEKVYETKFQFNNGFVSKNFIDLGTTLTPIFEHHPCILL